MHTDKTIAGDECDSRQMSMFEFQRIESIHTHTQAPPGWLSGERVGLMTWWL